MVSGILFLPDAELANLRALVRVGAFAVGDDVDIGGLESGFRLV